MLNINRSKIPIQYVYAEFGRKFNIYCGTSYDGMSEVSNNNVFSMLVREKSGDMLSMVNNYFVKHIVITEQSVYCCCVMLT